MSMICSIYSIVIIYVCWFVEKWLRSVPQRHFRFYLHTFKKVVSHVLCLPQPSTDYEVLIRQSALQIILHILQMLYKVSNISYAHPSSFLSALFYCIYIFDTAICASSTRSTQLSSCQYVRWKNYESGDISCLTLSDIGHRFTRDMILLSILLFS